MKVLMGKVKDFFKRAEYELVILIVMKMGAFLTHGLAIA